LAASFWACTSWSRSSWFSRYGIAFSARRVTSSSWSAARSRSARRQASTASDSPSLSRSAVSSPAAISAEAGM
jgi:hypothetical protein